MLMQFEDLPIAQKRASKRRKRSMGVGNNTLHSETLSNFVPSQQNTLVPRPINPISTALGVGIHPLDPNRLSGSQRLGIIGLPICIVCISMDRVEGKIYTMQALGTGKSTCCMSLLNQLRFNFPIVNVFSGSEADNPYYSLCVPKLFINTTVTRKGLKQFINRQRLALAHDAPLKDALLVLDDCFDIVLSFRTNEG